jgi:chromosome segregation ATPase
MQDSIPTPHGWQLVYLAIASIVTSTGTLIVDRLIKRKREPAEIRKIEAETEAARITADISPVGITLETLREIQVVIQKAEDRRQEWLLKEEQMRMQIVFWRNKAEELDGELADSRQANQLYDIRLKHHENQQKKLKALLDLKGISYSEADHL